MVQNLKSWEMKVSWSSIKPKLIGDVILNVNTIVKNLL